MTFSSIVSCQWDFGDGSSASGPVVEHRFGGDATFEAIGVRVTDGNGL